MVKFRFDGDDKSQIGEFTYQQYDNMKALPIVVECKIVLNEQPTLTIADTELINEKIVQACKADRSHASNLSK